ncbi:MAG: polyphosphate polymerase domain-containing protein [Eubacterium sp.]|nr:polyphosphate polymerase domain-containing protein [Eubacterium sp.]
MDYQNIFKRHEIKYLLDSRQKEQMLEAMKPYMRPDQYGNTCIRNIYYDTDTFRLIRRSLEKPAYKEKLRIRSYRAAAPDDMVFVELKKKYQSVVYKRRIAMTEQSARECFQTGAPLPVRSQIADEIDYFRCYYQPLRPAVFLSYEREAYESVDGSGFRVTFDENIQYRQEAISLGADLYGTPLLKQGEALMEIKAANAIPLWMSRLLASQRIYQTSFSKYGAAYQRILAEARVQDVRTVFPYGDTFTNMLTNGGLKYA